MVYRLQVVLGVFFAGHNKKNKPTNKTQTSSYAFGSTITQKEIYDLSSDNI